MRGKVLYQVLPHSTLSIKLQTEFFTWWFILGKSFAKCQKLDLTKLSYSEDILVDNMTTIFHSKQPHHRSTNISLWEGIYSGQFVCWTSIGMIFSLLRGKGQKKCQSTVGSLFYRNRNSKSCRGWFTFIPVLQGKLKNELSMSIHPPHWELVQNFKAYLATPSSLSPFPNLPERCSCCCIIARCRGVPGRGFRRGWLAAGKG